MTTHRNGKLGVVLFRDSDRWVAQGLEFDIAASGRSTGEALKEFWWAFVAAIVVDLEHGQSPLASTPKAPEKFWALFKGADGVSMGRPLVLPPGLEIPTGIVLPLATETRVAA